VQNRPFAVFVANLSAAVALPAAIPRIAFAQAAPPQQPPAAPKPAAPVPAAGGAQTPSAPPPAVPASRRFARDAGMILNVIKPDKGPDFEAVMKRIKEALAKSQDPKKKQMALGWRVFKVAETGPGGNLVYVFFFDPPVKDEDYSITDILSQAFPTEAQDLWAKFTQCFVSGQTMASLNMVVNMSPTAPAVTTPK
jgi:pyruvate/2-oxoglutarate dehydrogenase complex dihydrolipoamide acyltransferase (E2) component